MKTYNKKILTFFVHTVWIHLRLFWQKLSFIVAYLYVPLNLKTNSSTLIIQFGIEMKMRIKKKITSKDNIFFVS